jgi:hypothetical protein
MSFQITTAFVQQYKSTIDTLLQQRGGKLASAVMNDSFTGKAAKAVEQIGSVTPTKNLSRHADTPLISTPHDARWIFPNDYSWADLIDDQDKLRMIIDPTSSYAQNALNAMRRAQDEEILLSFFSAARTGENGTTSTAFPAGQIVAVNEGATGNTGLNVAKLRRAKRLLMAAGVDIDTDPLYCAITSAEHDNLLNEAQAISVEYNSKPVLVDGRINSFMGFNFIHVEFNDTSAYPVAAAPGGTGSLVNGSNQRLVPCWCKSGVMFGTWDDLMVKVSERSDKNYATQVYTRGTFGATRLQEKKIVQIICA